MKNTKPESRIDIFKTKIVRTVYKLPQILAAEKSIVRTALHKSQKYDEYVLAFRKSYELICQILREVEVEFEDTPRSFFDFCALHFPWEKVLTVGRRIGVSEEEIEKLDESKLRQKTSLKHFKEMAKTNLMFIPLLQLSVKLTEPYSERFRVVFETLKILEQSLSDTAKEA